MRKTYTYTLTLDELDMQNAEAVLHENGLTVEGIMRLILERTGREGAVPLRRGRPPRAHAAVPELPELQTLFDRPEKPAENTAANADDGIPDLHPTPKTVQSLQEADTMLRWLKRERDANPGGMLMQAADEPLQLIETRQFRFDKATIIGSEHRQAIIHALEVLFTDITERRTPAEAVPADNGCMYVPLTGTGLPAGLYGLIYKTGEEEICLVRYGEPKQLLANPPRV